MTKKRKREDNLIDDSFLSKQSKRFRKDPVNILIKNAVNSIGSMFTTINSDKVNKLSHNFIYTLKKKQLELQIKVCLGVVGCLLL
jgi:hypothetical protein